LEEDFGFVIVKYIKTIEIHLRHKYSFWDSMIIQAAIRGAAALLLTEDLPDGKIINGVTIKNPPTYSIAGLEWTE
jgi:predicted nucleic acid-binding protein